MSGLRLKDQPESERPRERLKRLGPGALSPSELVAILLRTGLKGKSVTEVSGQMVEQYETLHNLAQATLDDLQKIPGVGPDKAVTLVAAFHLAQRMSDELRSDSPLVDTPEKVAGLLREHNRLLKVETFQILLLNTRRRLMRIENISQGTLDTLLVHPREVFKPAISGGAAAVILTHNHPSGDPAPSEADIKVTRDLIRAGQLLKIDVLDHIIMGHKTAQRATDYVSLKELGYFYT